MKMRRLLCITRRRMRMIHRVIDSPRYKHWLSKLEDLDERCDARSRTKHGTPARLQSRYDQHGSEDAGGGEV